MTLAEPILSLPSISSISSTTTVSTAANQKEDLSNLKSIIDEIIVNASAIVNKQQPETEVDETTTMINLNTSNDNSFSELNSSFTTPNANNVITAEQEQQVNEYLKKIFFEASKSSSHHQHEPQVIKLPYIEPEPTTTSQKDELSLTSSNLVFNDDLANLRDIIKEIRSNAASPVSQSSSSSLLDQTHTNQVNTTLGGGGGGGGITITDATSTFGQYIVNDRDLTMVNNVSINSSSSTLTTTVTHQNEQSPTHAQTEPHHIIIQVTSANNNKDSSSLLTNLPPVPTTNHQFEPSSSSNEYYATVTSTYERESRGDNQLYEVELLESDVDFETKGT